MRIYTHQQISTEERKTETNVEEIKKTEPTKPQLEIISYNDKIISISKSVNYLNIVGEVKNNGEVQAEYVKVTAKFYKDDKLIDREYTYVDNTDIPAGGVDTFEINWDIQDYDKYELLVN